MAPNTSWILWILIFIVHSVYAQLDGDKLYFTDQRRSGVLSMPLAGGQHTKIDIKDLSNPIAVAFDGTTDTIYVTERGGTAINRRKFIRAYSLHRGGIGTYELPRISVPDGLVVDHISKLLYYSDAGEDIIGALSLDLQHHTVIIHERLSDPRAVALDPLEGHLYWTDWSVGKQHIGRANMDGSGRIDLITRDLQYPNGLTLDTTGSVKYLYWCDAGTDMIKRCRTDGTDIRTIIRSVGHMFGLVVDETYVYFTDWKQGAIQKVMKTGSLYSHNVGPQSPANSTKYFGIALNKASIRLNGTNACSRNRGSCTHLCLPNGPSTRVCRCSHGYTLTRSGTGCEKLQFKNALLVTDQERRGLFMLDLDKDAVLRLPIQGHMNPKDIAIDESIGQYFWVDAGHDFIATGCFPGNCVDVIKKLQITSSNLVGLALDKVKQHIYLVDSGLRTISRMDYEAKGMETIIKDHLDKPRGIALDVKSGVMYWTDWGDQPRIEQARIVDGSDRKNFVSTDMKWPNCLTIDTTGKVLFWTDGLIGKIEMIRLDGTGRQILYESSGANLVGITYGHGNLYYSISRDRYIYSLNLQTKVKKSFGNGLFESVYGMDFISTDTYNEDNINRAKSTTWGTNTGTGGFTNNGPTTNNFINDDNKDSNGIDHTLIIIISVSIGGLFLIIVVIVIGIICCKHIETKRAQTSNSNPNPIPLVPLKPKEVTPPFAPTSKTGQTAPLAPTAQTEPGPIYSEAIERGPPRVRPAAELPVVSAVNHQLPAIPSIHPYLTTLPDIVRPTGIPRIPVAVHENSGYADIPIGSVPYAQLLEETREPPQQQPYTCLS